MKPKETDALYEAAMNMGPGEVIPIEVSATHLKLNDIALEMICDALEAHDGNPDMVKLRQDLVEFIRQERIDQRTSRRLN